MAGDVQGLDVVAVLAVVLAVAILRQLLGAVLAVEAVVAVEASNPGERLLPTEPPLDDDLEDLPVGGDRRWNHDRAAMEPPRGP